MDVHDDFSEDDELHGEDPEQSPEPSTAAKGKVPAGKGRKKEAGESRKAQNRIAQREFRLRKQQYIRELETRIEVLSASSDTRFDHLRDVVRALVDENKELRSMLSSMGSFFKADLGSTLPKMGLTAELFEEIINKGNSQTALDAFIKSKERIQGFTGAATPAIPSQTLSHSIFAGSGPGGQTHSPKTTHSAPPKRKRTSILPDKDISGKQASGLGSQKEATPSELVTAEGDRGGKRRAVSGTAPPTTTHSPEILSPASATTHRSAPSAGGQEPPASGYSILSAANDISAADLPAGRAPSSLVINSSTSQPTYYAPSFNSGPLGDGAGGPQPMTSHLSYQHQAYSEMLGLAAHSQLLPPGEAASGQPPMNIPYGPFATPASVQTPVAGPSTSTSGYPNLEQPYGTPFDFGAAFDFSFSPAPSGTPAPAAVAAAAREAQPTASASVQSVDSPDNQLRPIRKDESPEEYFESADVRASIAQQGERQQQAMQLIGYHLANFRANPSYHLPPSLVPTTLQRTIPHGRLIDGIPVPWLRDSLIRHRDKFNLGVALHQMFAEFKMHGSDVLSSDSWELGKAWMQLYPFLVDRRMVETANHWRAQRGDELIDYDEIARLVKPEMQ